MFRDNIARGVATQGVERLRYDGEGRDDGAVFDDFERVIGEGIGEGGRRPPSGGIISGEGTRWLAGLTKGTHVHCRVLYKCVLNSRWQYRV